MIYIYDKNYFLFFFFLLYTILSFFGYGADDDIYRIILSGQNLFLNGEYIPSRFQGALIPELIIGPTSLIGSFYFSNFISVILGVSSLYLFHSLVLKILDSEKASIATCLVALNPYFIIASTTSMDYIYSIFFILVCISMLQKKYFIFAAVFASFAISSRISNSLIIFVIYVYHIYLYYESQDIKSSLKYFLSGVLGVFFMVILFLPVFFHWNYSFGFFSYTIGDWSILGYISRFLYKNVALYGLVPFTMILYLIISNLKKLPKKAHVVFAIAIIIVQELLFLKIPLQVSYILPLVFIVFIIVSYLATKKSLLILLLIVFVNSFVTLDVLKFTYNDEGNEAIDATPGLFIKKGIFLEEIEQRSETYNEYKYKILSESQ